MRNFLFGFTLYYADYIFIRVYYREGGRQCCSMSLSALLLDKIGSSACCHWTAEIVDHILEFGNKMNLDSLQEGLIPDTETLSISNLPVAVHLDCREQQSSRLAVTLRPRANFTTKLTIKILRNRCKKSHEITAKLNNIIAKLTPQIPQNTRRPVCWSRLRNCGEISVLKVGNKFMWIKKLSVAIGSN